MEICPVCKKEFNSVNKHLAMKTDEAHKLYYNNKEMQQKENIADATEVDKVKAHNMPDLEAINDNDARDVSC